MRKLAIAVAVVTTITTGVIGVPISAHAGPPAALWVGTHGSGTACSKAQPCALTKGVTRLTSGGTLILEPGSYGAAAAPLTTTIATAANTLIEGEPGKAPPVIHSAADIYGLLISSIRDVHVLYSGSGNGVVASTSIDHVSVITQTPANVASACASLAASVTDSLCVNEGNQGIALTVAASVKSLTIRGVTAIDNTGDGTGILAYESQPNTTGHLAIINSIAIGIPDSAASTPGHRRRAATPRTSKLSARTPTSARPRATPALADTAASTSERVRPSAPRSSSIHRSMTIASSRRPRRLTPEPKTRPRTPTSPGSRALSARLRTWARTSTPSSPPSPTSPQSPRRNRQSR